MLEKRYNRFRGDYSLLAVKPAPPDDEIRALVRNYLGHSPGGRAQLRHSIDAGGFDALIHFAKRCAVLALRDGADVRIREGLAALTLVDPAHADPGDLVLSSALLAYAAREVPANPPALLAEASAVAAEDVADLIAKPWVQGPVRLSDWGKARVETRHGVGLVEAGARPYRPDADLVSLALDIAERLSDGRYCCGDPMIGRSIPAVWFHPNDARAVCGLTSRAAGVATLSGDLRPEYHPRHSDQMLAVFLAEMATEADASAAAQARPADLGAQGAVCLFSAERVLGVVVGRSLLAEAPGFEDPASLAELTGEALEAVGVTIG